MGKQDLHEEPAATGPSAQPTTSRSGGDSVPADAAPTLPSGLRPPRSHRLPHAAQAVVTPVMLILVVLGPLFGGLTYRVARDRQWGQEKEHLEDELAARANDLRTRTLSIVEALHAVKSFFDCSDFVSSDEFSRYTRDARTRHPAIHVIEWIPVVPARSRSAYEARMRKEGVPDYEIRERDARGQLVRAAERPLYYPVCFAEPHAGNEEAIGFDVGSETRRDAALDRAAESREAALTDPIALVQDPAAAQSVLGFLAVFDEGDDGSHQGTESLRGFALVACRIPDLVHASRRDAKDGRDEEVEIRLLDAEADGRQVELFASPGWSGSRPGPLDLRDEQLHFAGQTWLLQGRPTAAYQERQPRHQPVVVAIVAILLWELLCAFVILLGKRSRDRVTRKQAGFIRSVLQSLTEGVVVADGDGRIQLANDAADRLVGADARSLPAAEWSSTLGCYLPDAETPYPVEHMPLARAIRGRQVVAEDMFVRKGASESGVWLSVSASPIRDEDDGVAGGVVVFRDITERKKSEAAILRLSQAVEQTADAVIITDRGGRIEYVNAAFEATTGYARDEVLGRTPRILGPESYTDEQYRNLWRTILKGEVYRTSDATRRKDGQIYHVEQTITPMRDARGRVTHFVSVARDITEKMLRREQQFEMDIAAKVQQRLFPQTAPQVDGLDIAGAVFPAAETSGDYYDYIGVSDSSLTLAIGDVSGHGFGPALLMAETRAYLRTHLAEHPELDAALARLNHSLLVDVRSEHFVTLLLAHVDRKAGTLVHANAGHVPGYVLDSSGAVKAELLGTGPILGIFDDCAYTCGAPIAVVPGDIVVLLTDGVTETQRAKDDFYGYERALDVVRRHRAAPAREIVEHLYRAVREFSREDDPRDDTTLVICKVE